MLHHARAVELIAFGGAADDYLNLDGEVLADSNSSATSIPLQDGSGSTIALVNSATGLLTTQYTYDPAGNVTSTGSPSSFPFLAGGAQYDSLTGLYAGEGNYYNPVLQRAISMVGATSGSGSQGGMTGDVPGGQSGTSFGRQTANTATAAVAFIFSQIQISFDVEVAPTGPPGWAVAAVFALTDLFMQIFDSGGHPWINPKLYQPQHSINWSMLGTLEMIPDTQKALIEIASSGAPLKSAPYIERTEVRIPGYNAPFPGYNSCGPDENPGDPTDPTDACCQTHDQCYGEHGLTYKNVHPLQPGLNASPAQQQCDQALCDCIGNTRSRGLSEHLLQGGIGYLFCYNGQWP